MKKLTKAMALVFVFVLTFSAFAAIAYAENEKTEEQTMFTVDPTVWGDLNGDGYVTAGDARACLRVAAMLDTLTDKQKAAADIYGNGEITARNARKILRVAAKLDIFDCYTVTISVGEKFTVKKLMTAGSGSYTWQCAGNSNSGLTFSETMMNDSPSDIVIAPGKPAEQIFTFTANAIGQYELNFQLKTSWFDHIEKEFKMIVVVAPVSDINLQVGEQYQCEDLRGLPNTPWINWEYTVDNDDGLAVDHVRVYPDDPNLLGGSVKEYFVFTAQKTGVYRVNIYCSHFDPENNNVGISDSFYLIITITE